MISRAFASGDLRHKQAAALDMSEVTVWRWTRQTAAWFQCGSCAMLKLMLDPSTPAAVRVRAAEGVLGHAEKTFELEDVAVRLKRLEQATRQK